MTTFGDMAEALYRLRKEHGLYYNPSEQEIFEKAQGLNKVKLWASSHR